MQTPCMSFTFACLTRAKSSSLSFLNLSIFSCFAHFTLKPLCTHSCCAAKHCSKITARSFNEELRRDDAEHTQNCQTLDDFRKLLSYLNITWQRRLFPFLRGQSKFICILVSVRKEASTEATTAASTAVGKNLESQKPQRPTGRPHKPIVAQHVKHG